MSASTENKRSASDQSHAAETGDAGNEGNAKPTGTPNTPYPFGWRFVTPLLLGSTLNPINSAMIATALVGIGKDMQAGPGAIASLISVLYLCSAVSQPTMGKLSTVFGPRRVFLAGVLILLLAGVLGATASSFGMLLVSRALIGVGTSAAYPTAMALVRKRADALGMGVPSRLLGNFSIAAQVTAVVGLPLGGVLAGAFGWRAIFAVNIPLALVSLAFTFAGIAKDAPIPRKTGTSLWLNIDAPGIALFAATITSLLLCLMHLAAPSWPLALLAVLTVVFGAALYVWEQHAPFPLIDFRMLARNLPLLRTYLRQILTYLATYSILYGASQWMEQSKGLSPSSVGVILIPLLAFSIVTARLASTRGWVRWPLILGSVTLILSAAVMLSITHASSVTVLVGMTLLLAVTNGFGGFGNQATLYMQTDASDIAVASGLLRTATYLGAIFSSSLTSLTFGARASDSGLHLLAWSLGAIGVALLLLTVLDKRIPRLSR